MKVESTSTSTNKMKSKILTTVSLFIHSKNQVIYSSQTKIIACLRIG